MHGNLPVGCIIADSGGYNPVHSMAFVLTYLSVALVLWCPANIRLLESGVIAIEPFWLLHLITGYIFEEH